MKEGGWSHFCDFLRRSFGSKARSKEFFEDSIRADAGESRKSAGRSSARLLGSRASIQEALKASYTGHSDGSGLQPPPTSSLRASCLSESGTAFSCRINPRFSGLQVAPLRRPLSAAAAADTWRRGHGRGPVQM